MAKSIEELPNNPIISKAFFMGISIVWQVIKMMLGNIHPPVNLSTPFALHEKYSIRILRSIERIGLDIAPGKITEKGRSDGSRYGQ
jgi:hypothetical protein